MYKVNKLQMIKVYKGCCYSCLFLLQLWENAYVIAGRFSCRGMVVASLETSLYVLVIT